MRHELGVRASFFCRYGRKGAVFALRHIKLASIGIIYSLSLIVLLALLGLFFFGETLNRREIVGFGFAVVAIMLLGRFAG